MESPFQHGFKTAGYVALIKLDGQLNEINDVIVCRCTNARVFLILLKISSHFLPHIYNGGAAVKQPVKLTVRFGRSGDQWQGEAGDIRKSTTVGNRPTE